MQLFWDVGLKNLSFIVYDPEQSEIIEWDVVNTGIQRKVGITQLVKKMVDFLGTLTIFNRGIRICVIENQPKLNPLMRVVSGVLGTYIYTKYGIRTIYYNPSYKLMNVNIQEAFDHAGVDFNPQQMGRSKKLRASSYRIRKKASVYETRRILQENSKFHRWIAFFERHRAKQDDLADTFLMARTFNADTEGSAGFVESDSESESDAECEPDGDEPEEVVSEIDRILRSPHVGRKKEYDESFEHMKFCLEEKLRKGCSNDKTMMSCVKEIMKSSRTRGIVRLRDYSSKFTEYELERFVHWLLPEPHWRVLFRAPE